MIELRLYLRRNSLRGNDDCSWVLRGDDGRILGSGTTLSGLPPAGCCHLVLAADLVSVLPARLPDLPERKLAPLLPGAAEALALGDAEQLHVCLLERDAGGAAWLAVIDREWLQFTLDRLAAHGLRVDAALPEFLLLPLTPGAWTLLRHEEGVLLRISPCFGLALDQGDPPTGLRLALDKVAELQSVRPRRLRLYQGNAVHSPDVERWTEAGGVQVDLCGNWSWRDPAWPLRPNLLKGQFAPRHGSFDWRSLSRPVLAGIALLAAVQMVGVGFDWLRLSREERSLREEMVRAASSVLPPGAAVVDPVWQVGEFLKSAGAAQGRDGGGMIALMGMAGRLRPAGGAAELRQVVYEDGRLLLDYVRADPDWLERYVAALLSGGLLATREPAVEGGMRIAIGLAKKTDQGMGHGR